MRPAAVLTRVTTPAGLVALAGGNALLALGVARGGPEAGIALALVPVLLILVAALAASDRSILVFGAFALPMAVPINAPLPLPGPVSVYAADVLVGLAVVSWITARLLSQEPLPALSRETAILKWPFIVFAAIVLTATFRGHEAYGESLVGQPARLLLYATIATAMVGLDSRRLYRGIVAVFYAGTVWTLLSAAYFVATGTSQTQSESLSTGGTRILALSVSLYLAGALFLALLNLGSATLARERALHLSIAALATLGIVLSFGRGTFAAVAVVVPLMLVAFPRVRNALLTLTPLAVPFIVLALIFVPRAAPDLGPTFASRVTSSPSPQQDRAVRFRTEATEAVWRQVHESPLVGVGFGRTAFFTVNGVTDDIGQDPHNSWLYLLAGGGIVLATSFFSLLVAYTVDFWRRWRERLEPHARILLLWSACTLFTFLVNALAEPLFQWPSILLTIWILLLVPAAISTERAERATAD